jgi:RNA polymerase sigma-70 factor (ECF subfamily)
MATAKMQTATVSPAQTSRMTMLYRDYVDQALKLAFVLTGDRASAEDVTHDAFVRLFGRFAHRYPRDKFEAYLRRTIVNLCRDSFRRQAVVNRFLAKQRPGQELARDGDLEERDRMFRALLSLGARQRAALVLTYYLDMTEAQAAETLEISTTAFRSLLARARRGLKEVLGDG